MPFSPVDPRIDRAVFVATFARMTSSEQRCETLNKNHAE